jgi:hypothetical protein
MSGATPGGAHTAPEPGGWDAIAVSLGERLGQSGWQGRSPPDQRLRVVTLLLGVADDEVARRGCDRPCRARPADPGHCCIEPECAGEPSNVEALLHGRAPRRARTTRPCR